MRLPWYQKLLQQTDPHSEFERIVLQEIYQQGYKLPDTAQEFIAQANCKPDFLYKSDGIAVFCDGSVHDHADKRLSDQIEQDNLRYNTNYSVLSLRHDEDWQSKLMFLASLGPSLIILLQNNNGNVGYWVKVSSGSESYALGLDEPFSIFQPPGIKLP